MNANTQKDELLALLLSEENLTTPQAISRRDSSDACLPLSFAQQRLWFLEQLESGSSAYNIPLQYRLRGPLRAQELEQSLQALVERHESLRTSFCSVNGAPQQEIAVHVQLALSLTDLSHLHDEAQQTAVNEHARQEAQQLFNLEQAPLLRARLLKLDTEEHVLLLTMHHIISDGWSIGLLIRELSALYKAHCAGQSCVLPQLPIQYADYAIWQRDRLQGDVLDSELAYWREQLAGVSTLELPTDHPRPAIQRYRGGEERLELGQELSEQLRRLSREHGVTLYMTLLAAFQVLLLRYSGQSDIAIGTPVAGRTRRELESIVGCFVNTLVLRTDLSGEPSFKEVLKRVREVCLGAYAHQEVPFEKLVEELQPERDLSRHPLFQVMFTLAHDGREQLSLEGLQVQSATLTSESAKFDLSLVVQERGEELACALRYNAELYEAESGQRMLHHFSQLLTSLAHEPEINIKRAGMLSDEERAQLVSGWNETGREYEGGVCVHELFERQAALTPQAIALVTEQAEVSYEELNERANRVGHYLRARGVGAESVVGLCVERGIEMVVGMLGVLKAGGGYVPLDPQYPVERLEYMLADAGVRVVVTQNALRDVPGKISEQLVVVALDDLRERDEVESRGNLSKLTDSENLAYVIYTSGSTGLPKGVSVTHRNVVNFLTSMSREPGLSPLDTWLAVTTLSFDIAALEIWLPLITGSRLCIASRQAAADPSELARLLAAREITVMQATPATWRMLLENDWQGRTELKVLCGGEALTRELSNSLTARVAQVWNLYGPTETTIWSSAQRMKNESGAVSLGAPLLNTQLYVLDANLQPSPFGVLGELYIGGDGVARGYWQRADLTAARFIPDPYSERVGGRLYRTGDVARRQPDGSLLFTGRADHQVKVRGYRIETGEIESVLRQHAAIQECVVIVRADEGREPYLIAYCTGLETHAASEELRAHLRSKLPEYMIPATYLWLDCFPLTLNGKIDRRALPAPESGQLGSGTEYVAPQTELEEQLAVIWSEVLRVQRVGLNDNFFALGGHSLLATQVVSRMRQAVRKDFPLRLLFEHPTIAALSHALSAEELDGAPAALPETISRAEFMLDELLAELDGLSEDEVRLLLAEESVLPLEGALEK